MRFKTLSFLILITLIFAGNVFAAPGIKIVEPTNGIVVVPGQNLVIRLEAVEGLNATEGILASGSWLAEGFNSLPASFAITIPTDLTGKVTIAATAYSAYSGQGGIDKIDIIIKLQAALTTLVSNQNSIDIDLDWNGNIKDGNLCYISTIYGIYADGVERKIPVEELTFVSSDPSVVSVDSKGNYEVHKVDSASITVSSGNVSKTFPLVFHQPTGIRPSETILPTVQIDIQPPTNQVGWYNQDITITLTAQDNEGGSGISEISYQFPYFDAKSTWVKDTRVVIPFTEEGIYLFRYVARDKERNSSGHQSVELRIDKTPPQTTAIISPSPDADGWITSLPVNVSFTAQDNLSGVASTTPTVTLTKNGEYNLEYHSTDVAGNVESSKTVTVKIAVNDTTPPQITLGLQRLGWWSWFKFYKFIYSASDDDSGVKEVKAGLITPNVANFDFKFKKSKKTTITIDEKKQAVTINAPELQAISEQLKQSLLLINNNQLVHLDRTARQDKWQISQIGSCLFIKAPSIVFKAQVTDNAGNSASQELKF